MGIYGCNTIRGYTCGQVPRRDPAKKVEDIYILPETLPPGAVQLSKKKNTNQTQSLCSLFQGGKKWALGLSLNGVFPETPLDPSDSNFFQESLFNCSLVTTYDSYAMMQLKCNILNIQ